MVSLTFHTVGALTPVHQAQLRATIRNTLVAPNLFSLEPTRIDSSAISVGEPRWTDMVDVTQFQRFVWTTVVAPSLWAREIHLSSIRGPVSSYSSVVDCPAPNVQRFRGDCYTKLALLSVQARRW